MAVERDMPDGELFVGEDKTLYFEVLDDGTPVDITAWAAPTLFVVRVHDNSATAIVEKLAPATGTYNPVRALNTQRATVTLEDGDTGVLKPRVYRYSLKRMDPDQETVLFYGDFPVRQATAR